MSNFKDHFSNVAREYAQYRPIYPQSLYDWLLPMVKTKNTAWDVGTGNGQVANDLSSYFKKVIASDASASQIEHAIKKENIEYGVFPGESTPLSANSIDLITVGQALHWFNFELFWKEVKRVSAPGAVMACWAYTRPFFEEKEIMAVLHSFYSDIDAYWPEERKYIEQHYNTIPFPFDIIDQQSFDMTFHFAADDLISYLRTWSSVQQYQKETGNDILQNYDKELKKVWPDVGLKKECIYPLYAKAFSIT